MTSGHFQLNGGDGNDSNSSSSTATTNTLTTGVTRENEKIRNFVFTKSNNSIEAISSLKEPVASTSANAARQESLEKLEIQIPELLQSGYSFYTWPCAPVLAWFLWERRGALVGKRILELGAGTALPGILAAKCGAQVILSDNCILPKSLAHIQRSCEHNNLVPGRDIRVIGLSWGLLLNSVFSLGPLDIIIAADCFYDPSIFEDIIVTISFLLDRNPSAKFIFTYQERSADWCIEALLKKWKLRAILINSEDIGKASGIEISDIIGNHTIHLLEITKES
uniref:Methyltransferase-like protein 23 n=1 Tax=Glossina pallidipes TaxID=7398 RepID=A0A1A9ZWX2_GLOPL